MDAANSVQEDNRDPAVKRAEAFRTQGERETVEAFVVAFILALLFRAFIAEAFVIPTGSMAPALMGAHKDLFCDRCNQNFPVGASRERANGGNNFAVVGGVCPNCRHINSLDLANNRDHHTFNGDRILVSKFAYTISEPKRWDVIVFKFPGNPKQNYIKRLVGLPNETLSIQHGDIFARPVGSNAPDGIVRKPPEKLLAMQQHVYDTAHQSQVLIDAKYPSRWQPWRESAQSPPTDSWVVNRDSEGLTATLESRDAQRQWLRYYHRWPTPEQWSDAESGKSLEGVDPYQSRLITDFYSYNSLLYTDSLSMIYKVAPGQQPMSRGRIGRTLAFLKSMVVGPDYEVSEKYNSGGPVDQFGNFLSIGDQHSGRSGLPRLQRTKAGQHWVGDLIFEADVETSGDSKELVMELVEAGVKYQCIVDLASGKASLAIDDNGQARAFKSADGKSIASPAAMTDLRAGSRHRIRFSNCDDELLMWVDDTVIEFDAPTTYKLADYRSAQKNHPQYGGFKHPLDAAPVGIAVNGGKSTIHHMRLDRDKYYIATSSQLGGLHDYDVPLMRQLGKSYTVNEIQEAFSDTSLWSKFDAWGARRKVSFELQEDQFFPMGDNSPASMDARCWIGSKRVHNQFGVPQEALDEAYTWADASYVPRDLLVGKALLVFWPHPWTKPVPMTPNFKRFKVIR